MEKARRETMHTKVASAVSRHTVVGRSQKALHRLLRRKVRSAFKEHCDVKGESDGSHVVCRNILQLKRVMTNLNLLCSLTNLDVQSHQLPERLWNSLLRTSANNAISQRQVIRFLEGRLLCSGDKYQFQDIASQEYSLFNGSSPSEKSDPLTRQDLEFMHANWLRRAGGDSKGEPDSKTVVRANSAKRSLSHSLDSVKTMLEWDLERQKKNHAKARNIIEAMDTNCTFQPKLVSNTNMRSDASDSKVVLLFSIALTLSRVNPLVFRPSKRLCGKCTASHSSSQKITRNKPIEGLHI